MKMLGAAVLIVFSLIVLYQSLNNEADEYSYTLESMSFLPNWDMNQDHSIACHQEGRERSGEVTLEVHQINNLVKNGLKVCALEGPIVVPLNVGRAFAETTYIPVKASIPYELAKRTLESDKPMRCSDYMKPLILTCPLKLSPYFKRVEFPNEKE